ncbi:hypothetical protein B0H14DRAFT_3082867 [Mycena olivaceomarginata]|nr:hypothetical protein B0H14DRAFT_3082867 [Mycena olivaceomarginata]
MAPKIRRGKCQICNVNESKYTCSGCATLYCSVPCYKKHKDSPTTLPEPPTDEPPLTDEHAPPLRPLTSLKWPYRDDPKPLQTHQYEAIATSSAIRTTLAAHPNLPVLLTSIDKLRGPDREHALQRALGVTAPEIAIATHAGGAELSEDLAEAVEAAVRGKKEGALGLDWGE